MSKHPFIRYWPTRQYISPFFLPASITFKVTPEGHPRDDSPVCKTTLDVLSLLPAIINQRTPFDNMDEGKYDAKVFPLPTDNGILEH